MSAGADGQLDAGGFARLDARVDAGKAEPVVARVYGGSVLGQRNAVRLTSDQAGPAEDLAMEYLGLELQRATPPLAYRSKRALGFAAWALYHHPSNAKPALRLVKSIKAAARLARSKPGHAWNAFTEMATQLDRTVPHFLPYFWEEAARTYKELGNQHYAARAFSKALEAERTHALDIDREHRRDTVLEFTLSGCLSGKAISQYAKDLQQQFDASEAYDVFRDLVVRRTFGGMAPTATMGKDLIRLAKAAGRNADTEIEQVLEEIVSAPSVARAPLAFWRSLKSHVKRICRRNSPFAMWLLVHTRPEPRYYGEHPVWPWLDFLDECGVLELLSADELPPDPEIPGGRAAWIGRLARLQSTAEKQVFELIEKMAAPLRKVGRPIPLFDDRRHGWIHIDADVIEAFLAQDIPLCDPPDVVTLCFDGWLMAKPDHPRRNSDLKHLAADARFAPLFREAMDELVKATAKPQPPPGIYGRQRYATRSFEDAAVGHAAVCDFWRDYLRGELIRLEQGGLADAEIALAHLRNAWNPTARRLFPEIGERLATIDFGEILHRTLRAGVLDEYGWPALEEAARRQPLPRDTSRYEPRTFWGFPYLSYSHGATAVVVGPNDFATYDLPAPAGETVALILPVRNDVLVGWRRQRDWKEFCRWSRHQGDPFVPGESLRWYRPSAVVPWQEGAIWGRFTVVPGDTRLPRVVPFFHDGRRFWMESGDQMLTRTAGASGEPAVFEFDPLSGRKQRRSIPPWIEEQTQPGERLIWNHCRLLPLPGGVDNSPLGSREGLIGWVVVQRRDGSDVGRGIDGRQIVMSELAHHSPHRRPLPQAMMDQPAGDSHWVFLDSGLVVDAASGVGIADYSDNRATYVAGQPVKVPVDFLHLMKVRHLPSSQRLRSLSLNDARRLLDAALITHRALQRGASEDSARGKKAAKTVRSILPAAPPQLVTGIARIARIAAEEKLGLENLIESSTAPAAANQVSFDTPSPEVLLALETVGSGILQLAIPGPSSSYVSPQMMSATAELAAQMHGAVEFFHGGKEQKRLGAVLDSILEPSAGRSWGDNRLFALVPAPQPWFALLPMLPELAWRCFWLLATDHDTSAEKLRQRLDQPWLEALRWLADSGLLDLPGAFRIYHADQVSDPAIKRHLPKSPMAWAENGNRYIARHIAYENEIIEVLEYSPKGQFLPPAGFRMLFNCNATPDWSGADLQKFITAVEQATELPLLSSEELEKAAEELGVSPIAVAVVWMGNLRPLKWGAKPLSDRLRSHYNWKVNQIHYAVAALNASPLPGEIVSAPVCQDPAAPFGEKRDSALQRLIDAWKDHIGDSLPLPEEVTTVIAQRARQSGVPVDLFTKLLRESTRKSLLSQARFTFKHATISYWEEILLAFQPPRPEGWHTLWLHLPFAVQATNYLLPAGHPVRQALSGLIDSVREFLQTESAVFPVGGPCLHTSEEDAEAKAAMSRLVALIGPGEKRRGMTRFDNGLLVGAAVPPSLRLAFRASRLHDPMAISQIEAVSELTTTYLEFDGGPLAYVDVVRYFDSKDAARIADVNRQPTSPDRWDQDPRNVVPELVETIATEFDITTDAAVYYLQLLALPDPTNANIRRWNGWTTARIKKAGSVLADAELVLEAKRARAGRSFFLPGGWIPLKAPRLPLESWKLPLYGLAAKTIRRWQPTRPIIPRGPVSDLFQQAWSQVESGDGPRFEELK